VYNITFNNACSSTEANNAQECNGGDVTILIGVLPRWWPAIHIIFQNHLGFLGFCF
jgi:hypothetical protein